MQRHRRRAICGVVDDEVLPIFSAVHAIYQLICKKSDSNALPFLQTDMINQGGPHRAMCDGERRLNGRIVTALLWMPFLREVAYFTWGKWMCWMFD
jgi:hypothetical protein